MQEGKRWRERRGQSCWGLNHSRRRGDQGLPESLLSLPDGPASTLELSSHAASHPQALTHLASTRNPLLYSSAAKPSPFKNLLFYGFVFSLRAQYTRPHHDSPTCSVLSSPGFHCLRMASFTRTWFALQDELERSADLGYNSKYV